MTDNPGPGVSDPLVRLWGMDANGKAFFQNARARNLTDDSALLAAVESELKAGDVIGVQLGDKKARCKIVSVANAGQPSKVDVTVSLLEGQESPWKDSIGKAAPPPVNSAPSLKNKRRYVRHKVRFPIEMRDDRGSGSHMQTNATDISGRGCYVEMLIPFPLGTPVTITFWLEQEKVVTSAVVRASDPGVGMGLEFVGLPEAMQERLQRHLEVIDESRLGPKVPSTTE